MLETWKLSWHIVRRNWWVYRKDFIANVSPTAADPAFVLISLGVGLGAFVSQVGDRSYAAFLAPGIAVATAMFTSFFETSYGFYVRMTFENIFKAMLTTPIGIREIVFGEFLWVALKSALMVTGVTLVIMTFGLFASPINLLLVPMIVILVGLSLGAIGLISTCLVRNINQFQTVYSFLIAPLYFFSGIFFPLDQMPTWVQMVAKALPLYHGVALSQAAYWDENVLETFAIHGTILTLYSAVLLAVAFYTVKRKLQS